MKPAKGRPPVNRKLPPDDVVVALARKGLNQAEIAARCGTSAKAVNILLADLVARDPLALLPALPETPAKIVTSREILDDGRDFRTKWIRISLPRIPTLHGHFVAGVA